MALVDGLDARHCCFVGGRSWLFFGGEAGWTEESTGATKYTLGELFGWFYDVKRTNGTVSGL